MGEEELTPVTRVEGYQLRRTRFGDITAPDHRRSPVMMNYY